MTPEQEILTPEDNENSRAQQFGEKVRRLLQIKRGNQLRKLLTRHNFADIAEIINDYLSEDEAVACFQLLDIGHAAQVLTSLDEDRQRACLSSLEPLLTSKILRTMATDDAVDILQELDTEQTRRIIEEMPFDTETRTLQNLLLEEPDTAAGIMSPDYIEISVEATVGDAMRLIKRAEEKDFIYYCYMVDADEKLVGVLSLKQLILHDESVPLSRIATFDVKSILMTYDQEFAANLFRKYYNLLAMPVVDAENRLQGIITLDDIVDVIEEETSEDIYQAAGINLDEIDERNLLHGPAMHAVKARLPWLSITVVGQLLAAMIIASYQKTVSEAVIAISFMPLLTGLTGNMGTQSDTIAVRGLSQNLINDENIWEKYRRELRVAMITAVTFSVPIGLFSFFVYHHWVLSVLLASWILISVCCSASAGILLPYWYRRIFKQDPAGVGGPFITTTSDILTFTIYLYIVTMLLDKLI